MNSVMPPALQTPYARIQCVGEKKRKKDALQGTQERLHISPSDAMQQSKQGTGFFPSKLSFRKVEVSLFFNDARMLALFVTFPYMFVFRVRAYEEMTSEKNDDCYSKSRSSQGRKYF